MPSAQLDVSMRDDVESAARTASRLDSTARYYRR
jgi:hypothetical protein